MIPFKREKQDVFRIFTDWPRQEFDLPDAKALAKLGNIVAETLLRRQIFPSLAARETMLRKQILPLGNKKMFLPLGQIHFCFPDINIASATYVSQFSHPRKHDPQQCFRNNVS